MKIALETHLTVRECARYLGKTPRTIQNYLSKGKLTSTRDDEGHHWIKLSELRCFQINNTKPII